LAESQYELIPGGIKLKVDAGRPGDHKISGDLVFKNNGIESRIPVDQMYSVIAKPNSAVISADKMNVVYRGVANPMTISIPGIPDNKINATAPGLKRLKGSKFIMNPGKGREIKITASGTLPDGQRVSTSTKFRIKDIPRPTGTVRGQMGTIKIPKNNLSIATIGAVLDDFDFDIKLKTVSFKFKVPGQATIVVNGSKLDAKAKGALRRAKAGQSVQIFDIKVKNPNNPSYQFKKVSPVICEIVN
jgi:gliding motility-associated protein GldM